MFNYVHNKIVTKIYERTGVMNIRTYHVWGSKKRLHLGKNVRLTNTILNVSSGDIYVGDNSFCSHNVMILTGYHDYTKSGEERRKHIPNNGNDIHIENGVWIGAGAIILGGVHIGENAVIGAGSVVTRNVPQNVLVAGNPAKIIKEGLVED